MTLRRCVCSAWAAAVFIMGDNVDFKIVKTNKNKDMIFYKNYFFTKHSSRINSQFWRCQDRKCPASLTTPLNVIDKVEQRNIHNHILSENDIPKIFLSNTIKDLAENTAYSTHAVYSLSTNNKQICELPIVNKRNCYKNILNSRKRNSIVVDNNRNLDDISVSTFRGEKFCLFDSVVNSEDRIVILATENNLNHLQNSSILIADGTFKECPKEFLQLYVLHGKISSNVYPFVYILLKTKKETDYLKAFTIIQEKWSFEFPNYIVIDFELAALLLLKKQQNLPFFLSLPFWAKYMAETSKVRTIVRIFKKYGISLLYEMYYFLSIRSY